MRPSFILLAVFALPAHASETPDHQAFIEKAKKVAVVSLSAHPCKRLGFWVDEAGIRQLPDRAVTEAVYEGIDLTTARNLMLSTLDAKAANDTYLAEQANADDEASMNRYLDYWKSRCDGLVADPYSSPYFRDAP